MSSLRIAITSDIKSRGVKKILNLGDSLHPASTADLGRDLRAETQCIPFERRPKRR